MKQTNSYDALRLENQLCFPLYAAAKEVVKKYNPFLSKLDLTYTQYITMMVLWEQQEISVKELGAHLYLDSGTLTPLLKTLEKKGFLTRNRLKSDERVLIVKITEKGLQLREQAVAIPEQVSACIALDPADAVQLYQILQKLLGGCKHD